MEITGVKSKDGEVLDAYSRNDGNWPFEGESKVMGMPLPKYLEWAAGFGDYPKKLFLPPIQRGFVWKPLQIAQLWDSLLRGMPIGSLMVSKLSEGQKAMAVGAVNRSIEQIHTAAIGLFDGQQRTLAMLLGWNNAQQSDHQVWIDLGERGVAGSPFEIRITTRTQPFGFQRHGHGKLSRHDRREARKNYDKRYPKHEGFRDFELFEHQQALPWKAGKSAALCFSIKELWAAFRAGGDQALEKYVATQFTAQSTGGGAQAKANYCKRTC